MDQNTRVLIVEDEFLIALSFQKELERLGYEVLGPTATGQGAIETARQERPDIVLMDKGLAGTVNGLDAAKEIIDNLEIPVIIMTGHSDEGTLEQINLLNPVACLIKPILGREIHNAIEKYFQGKER